MCPHLKSYMCNNEPSKKPKKTGKNNEKPKNLGKTLKNLKSPFGE
jgi:hypothetical protein